MLHSGTPALPENIRLGLKGLPETNTLAYFKNPLITTVKSFIVQAPVLNYHLSEIFVMPSYFFNIINIYYFNKLTMLAKV